ncbi:MAG: M23 family metallopeptidase [Synergistaceae bacterium]|nr:M23 family metallopeptidase [Synergistaceae bacterium]
MSFTKYRQSTLGKILVAILAAFLLLLLCNCNVTYARKTSRRGSTQSVRYSHKSSKKSGKSKKSKTNKKGKSNKCSKKSGKRRHGKHRRERRRRGHARYVSSAESKAQKKQIAATTLKLAATPDLSGDVLELSSDSYVWPVRYGYIARGVGRGHSGVDIMSRAGDPIYAVADGTVTTVYVNNPKYRGYGKMCIISHPDKGTTSLYSHCAAVYVREGQDVKRGQKIAIVGRTGLTTTNHLHFEMRKNGRRLNPERVLPQIGALGHKYVPH